MATALGLVGGRIPPITVDAAPFVDTRIVPYGLPGDEALIGRVVEALVHSPAVLLQNHGLITVGWTVRHAASRALAFEETMRITLACRLLDGATQSATLSEDTVTLLQMTGLAWARRSRGEAMSNGYWGKVLFANLSTRRIETEVLPESMYRRYLGGYGLGVAILYERMPAGADPMGPENVIGFLPGLLTGSGAPFSGRFMVAARSPLTRAWGDANCGGNFGPVLRGAGYDGVFVSGVAERPVYLYLDGERAELRDATDLWGLDATQTRDAIRNTTSSDVRVACIGPAGERCCLLAAIVNDGGTYGRALWSGCCDGNRATEDRRRAGQTAPAIGRSRSVPGCRRRISPSVPPSSLALDLSPRRSSSASCPLPVACAPS